MTNRNEKRVDFLKNHTDSLLPFQLEKSIVRGRITRLNSLLNNIFERHKYPKQVEKLLAETIVMTASLGSALKFDGIFTVQTKTDGAINRIVVDVTSDGKIRACATYDKEKLENTDVLGKGHLVFTVEQKSNDKKYQGVVALNGETLSDAFQLYFQQSEQIKTYLMVEAKKDQKENWVASCLMIQKMPRYGGEEIDASLDEDEINEDWNNVVSLMQTCTKEELLDLNLLDKDLLYRLFHEDGVRIYDRIYFKDECRCSRERLESIIFSMSKDDIKDMSKEDGTIEVTCEFCSKIYIFSV